MLKLGRRPAAVRNLSENLLNARRVRGWGKMCVFLLLRSLSSCMTGIAKACFLKWSWPFVLLPPSAYLLSTPPRRWNDLWPQWDSRCLAVYCQRSWLPSFGLRVHCSASIGVGHKSTRGDVITLLHALPQNHFLYLSIGYVAFMTSCHFLNWNLVTIWNTELRGKAGSDSRIHKVDFPGCCSHKMCCQHILLGREDVHFIARM